MTLFESLRPLFVFALVAAALSTPAAARSARQIHKSAADKAAALHPAPSTKRSVAALAPGRPGARVDGPANDGDRFRYDSCGCSGGQ